MFLIYLNSNLTFWQVNVALIRARIGDRRYENVVTDHKLIVASQRTSITIVDPPHWTDNGRAKLYRVVRLLEDDGKDERLVQGDQLFTYSVHGYAVAGHLALVVVQPRRYGELHGGQEGGHLSPTHVQLRLRIGLHATAAEPECAERIGIAADHVGQNERIAEHAKHKSGGQHGLEAVVETLFVFD